MQTAMYTLKYRMNGATHIDSFFSESARDSQAALLLMSRIAVVLARELPPQACAPVTLQ